jgi:hypothetical protein
MRKYALVLVLLTGAAGFAVHNAFAADADPTMHQVYEAAQSGHLDQAQKMMSQVLRDHPRSGKAHYVEAELYAKQGNYAAARAELSQAEQLEPGLPFAKPAAVQELKSELRLDSRAVAPMLAHPAASIPWGAILLLVGLIAVVWMVVRRRSSAVAPSPTGPVGGTPGGPYGGPGPYAGYGAGAAPPMGGGIGSGIAGGLASGLAVGAGVVAGEELAHHFLDGRREGTVLPPADSAPEKAPANSDMGGSDFGVSDDESWDDSSGGDGGGGDSGGGDWT